MNKTEVISVVSGKGGAGKTIVSASLGYALINAGHRVLMVDCDRGTQGLSLFLLGPDGHRRMADIDEADTLIPQLRALNAGEMRRKPIRYANLNRPDHGGVIYDTVVSDRSAYGESPYISASVFSTDEYCAGMEKFIAKVRNSNRYDYVIMDTRGGFSLESTKIAAYSDSIIIVTEPDYTSLFQIRNLLREISDAAGEADLAPVVRGVLVNRATAVSNASNLESGEAIDLNDIEANYRVSISGKIANYPIDYQMTHPLPADLAVVDCYRSQLMPLHDALGSSFSYALYTAFTHIMRVVTAKWTKEQVVAWSALSTKMDEGNKRQIAEQEEQKRLLEAKHKELEDRADKALILERELAAVQAHNATLERVVDRGGDRRPDFKVDEFMNQSAALQEKYGRETEALKISFSRQRWAFASLSGLGFCFLVGISSMFFYFFLNFQETEKSMYQRQLRYEYEIQRLNELIDESDPFTQPERPVRPVQPDVPKR